MSAQERAVGAFKTKVSAPDGRDGSKPGRSDDYEAGFDTSLWSLDRRVFGSVALGHSVPVSDVDWFVEVEEGKILLDRMSG